MARKRKVKCPKCEKLNEKENTVQIKTRYYCIKCAEEKEQEEKEKAEEKARKAEEKEKQNLEEQKRKKHEKKDWDELFDYICYLYDIDKPTGMMFGQLRNYRTNEKYKYTNKGMYLTLKYFYEILENDVREGTGLGVIPNHYEKAKQYYTEVWQVKKHLENFEVTEERKVVEVKIFDKTKERISKKELTFDDVKWNGVGK